MTQPHQIDREAVARALFDRHWSAIPDAKPVWPGDDGGDYWFWLADAVRPSAPEAVAWREKVATAIANSLIEQDYGEAVKQPFPHGDLTWSYIDQGEVDFGKIADAILALIATHPVQALDSSLRDTHRAAVTDVLADCSGCGVAPLRLHKADCEIMLSRTPASDTTGGYEAAGQRSEPKSTHPVQGGEG